jgi:hypothetical protein
MTDLIRLLRDCWMFIVAVTAGLAISIGVWVFTSNMEAKAFNNATGKNVSTWDAMWIELRVQEGAR